MVEHPLKAIQEEVFQELLPLCRRGIVCESMVDTADDIFLAERKEDLTDEVRLQMIADAKERIGQYCTGQLIDRGCWNAEVCPASQLAAPYRKGGWLERK